MNRAVLVYVCTAVLIGSTYLVKERRKSRRLKRYIKHACIGNTKLQGTIESTNVNLTWKMNRIANDSNPKVALRCSSCRVPNGNNAEFLINNRSDDSLTYNKETAKCTHRHGECSPDVCLCRSDENEFIRYYPLKDISPMTDFSCDMRFVDASKSMKFSKLSTVYFDGQEFHYKYTVTHMTTPLDDNLDGNTGYKEVLLWVGIISTIILVVTVLIVFGFYHRKRNKKKKKCDNEKRSSLDEKRCDNDKGSCLDEKICDNDKGTTLVGSCQLKRNIKVPSAANLSSLTGSQITLEATVTVEERHNNNGRIFVKGTRRLNACENEPLLTHSEGKQKPTESAVTVYKHVQKYTKDSRHTELSEEIHPESPAVIGDIETVSGLEIINDGNSAQAASASSSTVDPCAPAKSAGAHATQSSKSFDILFLNFETKAEDDWVVNATEVLENDCNLRCGCAQFGDDSFKYTDETTTIIMTFSEKSSKRKPAILSVIDYIQSVVVVLVEQCSIPVQRRHMKCVDATKGEKEWRNQLLTALGFKPQEDKYCNSITTRSTETK